MTSGRRRFRLTCCNDVNRLTNGNLLTFVMSLNYQNGIFPDIFNQYSLAEEFVRAQNKGAIACHASTGVDTVTQEVLAANICNRIFTEKHTIIG